MTVDREKINILPHSCYKITNLVNSKLYIGVTYKLLSIRLEEHIKKSKSKNRNAINDAIKKYGAENFTIEMLSEYPNAAEAFEAETRYIKQYNSKQLGYNETEGGDRGPVRFSFTREDIIKILELYVGNIDIKKIAAIMGRKIGSIHDITRLRFSPSHEIPANLIDNVKSMKAKSKKKHRITQEIILEIFDDYVNNNFNLAQLNKIYNYSGTTIYGILTRRTHRQFQVPVNLAVFAKNKFESYHTVDIEQISKIFDKFLIIKSISKVAKIFKLSATAITNVLYRNTYKSIFIDAEVEKSVKEILSNPPFNIQDWKIIDKNLGKQIVQDYLSTNLSIKDIAKINNISYNITNDILRGRTFDIDEEMRKQLDIAKQKRFSRRNKCKEMKV